MCTGQAGRTGASLCSGQVVGICVSLCSGHVPTPGLDLVSDQARCCGLSFVSVRIGRVEPSPKMLGEAEDRCVGATHGRNETLDCQLLENRPRGGTGETCDHAYVERTDPTLAADEGEGAGFRFVQMNPQACLEEELLLGQEFFLEEGHPKRLPRPVVVDDGWHAPELPPVAIDGAHAGARLFAQPDAPKGADDPRVANLPITGFEEFFGRRVGITGVPERRSILEEADHWRACMVGVVLVYQQVDRRLSEGDVVRWAVLAPQCRGVHEERRLGALQVAVHERFPRADEIGLDYQPVRPAFVRRILRPAMLRDREGSALADLLQQLREMATGCRLVCPVCLASQVRSHGRCKGVPTV